MSSNQTEEHMNDTMIKLFEKLEGHYEDGIICENET